VVGSQSMPQGEDAESVEVLRGGERALVARAVMRKGKRRYGNSRQFLVRLTHKAANSVPIAISFKTLAEQTKLLLVEFPPTSQT